MGFPKAWALPMGPIKATKWVSCFIPMLNCTIYCIYTPYNATERHSLWEELGTNEGPAILLGDFNMVESSNDQFTKLG